MGDVGPHNLCMDHPYLQPSPVTLNVETRIDNRTEVPTALVQHIADFVRPTRTPVSVIKVRRAVKNVKRSGCFFPETMCVEVRYPGWPLGAAFRAPIVSCGRKNSCGEHATYQQVVTYSPVEWLVFVLAHEIRHAWQHSHGRMSFGFDQCPLYPGCLSWREVIDRCHLFERDLLKIFHGGSIERDADCYALHMPRKWRREHCPEQVALLLIPRKIERWQHLDV